MLFNFGWFLFCRRNNSYCIICFICIWSWNWFYNSFNLLYNFFCNLSNYSSFLNDCLFDSLSWRFSDKWRRFDSLLYFCLINFGSLLLFSLYFILCFSLFNCIYISSNYSSWRFINITSFTSLFGDSRWNLRWSKTSLCRLLWFI